MAGTITTGNHPKALWPGVKAWFGVGYGEHPEEFRDLFEISSSSQAWEEDVMTTGFGLAPVKREGEPRSYTGHSQRYVSRYTHVAYSLGFIVTFEEMLNNLYEKVANSRSKSLGFSMRQTKENVGANVYNRATNSSYTGGDAVVLLSASHTTTSGNQSNILSPAADLSETSLEDLSIQIMGATDDVGLRIALTPQSLIIPRQLWYEARRILDSPARVKTADNDMNVLNADGTFPGGIKMNHFLTDTDQFFIRTNCPDGMKCYQRHKIDLEQDNDFDTKNAKAGSYDYYSFGWSDWRGVYGSPGA